MTDYTFRPTASAEFVNWSNPSIWEGGVVPNSPDADVDFPTVTETNSGQPYISFVSIQAGESFAVHSVALRDYLLIYGSLSVSGNLTQYANGEIDMSGGTLTAGTINNDGYDIQGDGRIIVDTLTNDTLIIGNNLTIDATTLINNGTLAAGGGVIAVNVGTGGLSGLAGGTLSSGGLEAFTGGTLALHAGEVITVDAATITLGGGAITSRDPLTGQDIALTSSLHSIAAAGTLIVQNGSYHFGQLEVAGTLSVVGGGQLSADRLVIAPGGHLEGNGTLNSAVENDGVIQAGQASDGESGNWGTLTVAGAIMGSGSLEVLPGHVGEGRFDPSYGATLELNGPTAENVLFDDRLGTLRLDQPTSFTGAITTASAGTVVLAGVSLASIMGVSYAGDSTGGTLTLQEAGGALTLRFLGSHVLDNFTLAAGPQVLSSDPPSLQITISGHGILPGQDFNGDGHSDILWQNVNGAVSTWHATGSGASDGIVQDTYDAYVVTSWTAVDSFDFNGDGRADILWHNQNGAIAIWDGTASGFIQSSYVDSNISSGASIVGAGDFDGDGRDDVLFRKDDGSIFAARSDGSVLQIGYGQGYSHDSVGTSWIVEGVADFSGDGKADILWRYADGSLSTWEANGSPASGIAFHENSWSHQPIDLAWHVVGLGDFDGDGRADILWRHDNGSVSVWTSTGSGGFAENQFNAYAATGWSVAEVGDFNGDGRADILWRYATGQTSIWHSTGSGWEQNTYHDESVGMDWTIAAHHFLL